MEHRNRNILVVLIGIVIAVAVFSSFAPSIFTSNTPEIVLPTPSASAQPGEGPNDDPSGDFVRVEVTPGTVQSVIATLSRPESYYREISVTDYWGDGESGHTSAKVWTDAHWTLVEATLPSGVVRHSLTGEGMVQIWYNGNRQNTFTAPADEDSQDVEGQRIPTYEDVLQLEQTTITAAGYEEKDGQACIYVEMAEPDLPYRERYWVAVDTGLLIAAETWDGDELVYSMSAYGLERPVPAGVLPETEPEE